jgi:hypothetical protein
VRVYPETRRSPSKSYVKSKGAWGTGRSQIKRMRELFKI